MTSSNVLLPSKRGKYKKRELKDALGSLLFSLGTVRYGGRGGAPERRSPHLRASRSRAEQPASSRRLAEYLNFTHHTVLSAFSIPSSRAV
jgi:hypothetical protein